MLTNSVLLGVSSNIIIIILIIIITDLLLESADAEADVYKLQD